MMQTLKDKQLDSMEIDEEPLIQFRSVFRDFLVNIAFTLPATFMVKERQSSVLIDVEENETSTTVIIKRDEPSTTPNQKLELEESYSEME